MSPTFYCRLCLAGDNRLPLPGCHPLIKTRRTSPAAHSHIPPSRRWPFRGLLFAGSGPAPLIDFRQSMVHRSQRFLFPDFGDPLLNCGFVCRLQSVEFSAVELCVFVFHESLLRKTPGVTDLGVITNRI